MDDEHTVDEVRSAEDALFKLPGHYNLIVSDILLKKMDGIGLLQSWGKIRDCSKLSAIIVIFSYLNPCGRFI